MVEVKGYPKFYHFSCLGANLSCQEELIAITPKRVKDVHSAVAIPINAVLVIRLVAACHFIIFENQSMYGIVRIIFIYILLGALAVDLVKSKTSTIYLRNSFSAQVADVEYEYEVSTSGVDSGEGPFATINYGATTI
jgi:hypothetical protein